MSCSRVLFLLSASCYFFAIPASSGEIISCDSFEGCPTPPTNEIPALKARIDALEALLAGVTRGIDPSTSQDTLTFTDIDLSSNSALINNSTSSETVVVRELSTTEREGDLLVCFNGEGELLPCDSNTSPTQTLSGNWSGRMIYDRRSEGSCHDADVHLRVDTYPSQSAWRLTSITLIRDTVGQATYNWGFNDAIFTSFIGRDFRVFDVTIDMTIQFDTQEFGSAQGFWNYADGSCYGEWTFTKD